MPIILTGGLGAQTAGGTPGFQVLSITPGATSVVINLNNQPVLSGPGADPGSYIITSQSGTPLDVTNVVAGATTITLTTAEHTGGISYTLNLPWVGILDIGGVQLAGPYDFSYIGVGVSPVIHSVRARNAYRLVVIFGDMVISQEALDPTHYTLDHGETVYSVEKLDERIYELTTSKLDLGVVITLTVSGVHSLLP